ncbi:MAG: hypothetical protein ACRC2R_11220 [Xenococcaceae cyanobacterium]
MQREYYPYWYRLDGINAFLLWFCDEIDGFFKSTDGKIPSFSNIADLSATADNHRIQVQLENSILIDLDCLTDWLKSSTPDQIDCPTFLNAWNLFLDVSTTVEKPFEDTEDTLNTSIYNKLFWGNNLSSVTPPGEHYLPEWSDEEFRQIHNVMKSGLILFRQSIKRL